MFPNKSQQPRAVDAALLHEWRLPEPDGGGDKNARGGVLVVGGSPETPGAIILAALAAMRCGVGRLRLATCASVAPHVAVALPEARVFRLGETPDGGIDPSAAATIIEAARNANAVLVGPGMLDKEATAGLVEQLLPQLDADTLILDAAALLAAAAQLPTLGQWRGNVILTPHAGEMARALDVEKQEVENDPLAVAQRAAREWGAVVALKGATTHIADPDGALYRYNKGNVGLAASGSGDTLAGAIAGLAARGASPAQAAAWGVYLHGEAGNRLAQRISPIGFLARELPHELPAIIRGLEQQVKG